MNDRFCQHCKATLDQEPPPRFGPCVKCGRPGEADMFGTYACQTHSAGPFCPNCGANLEPQRPRDRAIKRGQLRTRAFDSLLQVLAEVSTRDIRLSSHRSDLSDASDHYPHHD